MQLEKLSSTSWFNEKWRYLDIPRPFKARVSNFSYQKGLFLCGFFGGPKFQTLLEDSGMYTGNQAQTLGYFEDPFSTETMIYWKAFRIFPWPGCHWFGKTQVALFPCQLDMCESHSAKNCEPKLLFRKQHVLQTSKKKTKTFWKESQNKTGPTKKKQGDNGRCLNCWKFAFLNPNEWIIALKPQAEQFSTWVFSRSGCFRMFPVLVRGSQSDLLQWILRNPTAIVFCPTSQQLIADLSWPEKVGRPSNWDKQKSAHFLEGYLDLPFVCKICAKNHQKNLPKGRNFTYLEDPGITYLHQPKFTQAEMQTKVRYPMSVLSNWHPGLKRSAKETSSCRISWHFGGEKNHQLTCAMVKSRYIRDKLIPPLIGILIWK